LASSQETLANLLRDTKRHKEAEANYRQALDFYKNQPADDLAEPDFRDTVANCYNNFGILLRATSRPKEAEAAYRNALALQKQLMADFPAVPDYQNAVAMTLSNLAILDHQRGEFKAGLTLLEEARPHHQAALKAVPKNPNYRRAYRNNLLVVAECHAGLGDHARVATTADVLARFAYDPAMDNYYAAAHLCNCVRMVEKDTQLDKAKSKALAESYAERAIPLLRQAVARGFRSVTGLQQDPILAPLRGREDFKKLLAELEGKKQ
jgi:tetratricopeptide (TPR) repeat protein